MSGSVALAATSCNRGMTIPSLTKLEGPENGPFFRARVGHVGAAGFHRAQMPTEWRSAPELYARNSHVSIC